MSQSEEADRILSAALQEGAAAHESGNYEHIAQRLDDVELEILPLQEVRPRRAAIALNFWDSWCDARNHDWQYYPDGGGGL